VGDPVSYGLARSIARPGYNVTGLSNSAVEAMRLMVELLRSVRPGLARVVFLRHRTDPLHTPGVKTFRPAIEGAGLEAVEVVAAGQAEFEQAVESRREPAREAVLLMIPPEVDRPRVAAAAIRRRIPLLGFGDDDFIEDGGLMSLGMDYIDRTRRVAEITEKILRGANPAEIPFELPDRTHLCINRRTAARIGIELPASILLRASRVI
jgi:putative ABC transport system substrate-binding protein